MSGLAPTDWLREMGWRVRDAYGISATPGDYRTYLAESFGEWSVAKQAYVASRSGWFSCRSACYLALGVPAVVQSTGFEAGIPVGAGLFSFSTTDEAAAAVEAILTDPSRHAAAAADLAESEFDAGRVLQRLLEDAFASQPGRDRPETLATPPNTGTPS
jgi:hypothetical protein